MMGQRFYGQIFHRFQILQQIFLFFDFLLLTPFQIFPALLHTAGFFTDVSPAVALMLFVHSGFFSDFCGFHIVRPLSGLPRLQASDILLQTFVFSLLVGILPLPVHPPD